MLFYSSRLRPNTPHMHEYYFVRAVFVMAWFFFYSFFIHCAAKRINPNDIFIQLQMHLKNFRHQKCCYLRFRYRKWCFVLRSIEVNLLSPAFDALYKKRCRPIKWNKTRKKKKKQLKILHHISSWQHNLANNRGTIRVEFDFVIHNHKNQFKWAARNPDSHW